MQRITKSRLLILIVSYIVAIGVSIFLVRWMDSRATTTQNWDWLGASILILWAAMWLCLYIRFHSRLPPESKTRIAWKIVFYGVLGFAAVVLAHLGRKP
jgi:hypothetical protein